MPAKFNGVLQIEEKYWAHRRGSETASEGTAASFVGSFKLTALQSAAPLGEFPAGGDVFVEEDDEKHMKEELMAPGKDVFFLFSMKLIKYHRPGHHIGAGSFVPVFPTVSGASR